MVKNELKEFALIFASFSVQLSGKTEMIFISRKGWQNNNAIKKNINILPFIFIMQIYIKITIWKCFGNFM